MTFCNVKCPDEITSAGHHQINLAEFITFFTFSELGLMNEMMDGLSGSLDSTLFPRKQ